MTMPHSKRPRRNRVNKLRRRKDLPPLPSVLEVEAEHQAIVARTGTTTIMIPLPTIIRAVLTKVRRKTQQLDPKTVASDGLFAAAILTLILPQMEAKLFPAAQPLIVAPSPDALKQAKQVDKVLARPFVG